MDFEQLQAEHKHWLDHNFPRQAPHQALLGLSEELGELAHAHLKFEQAIRGYDRATYELEASDAIGDFLIYLASYCTTNGFSLQACVEEAWRRVKERDWVADPQKGGE